MQITCIGIGRISVASNALYFAAHVLSSLCVIIFFSGNPMQRSLAGFILGMVGQYSCGFAAVKLFSLPYNLTELQWQVHTR